MRALVDETLAVTLRPKLRPTSTLALLRQRLYRTSEAPLQLHHVYYTLQPITTFNYDFLLMSRTNTNRKQTGSIKCYDWQATYIDETGRNLSMRLTEYNERQEMVTSTIIYRRNIKSTGTLRHELLTLQTTINDSL